jgi:mRNA-degrading endonuclease YafQ of YafQ-DinJ toxin-antitoxin module
MGMTRMTFDVVRLAEFERDFRALARRYPTLEEDLETLLRTAVVAYHRLGLEMGIVRIAGIGKTRLPIFKVHKFACRSLKGRGARTGLRLIYALDEDKNVIELIEIYIKSDQENEDRGRIHKYYSGTER